MYLDRVCTVFEGLKDWEKWDTLFKALKSLGKLNGVCENLGILWSSEH